MRLVTAMLALAAALAAWTAPAAAQGVKSRMNDVQQNALTDGCWQRYNGNPGKLYPCLDGEAYWQDALIDGCKKRYAGNQEKLRRCVDTSSLYGGYSGGNSYGHNDHHDAQGRYDAALREGCYIRFNGYPGPLNACLSGDRRYASEALPDGCRRLYGYDRNVYEDCIANGHSRYSGNSYGNNHGGSGSSSYGATGLTDIQQNALTDGCWQRYNGNNSKLQPCLRGEAYWRDALRDGCWKRYNGNQDKLNRCLDY